jgi:hypothetical protein
MDFFALMFAPQRIQYCVSNFVHARYRKGGVVKNFHAKAFDSYWPEVQKIVKIRWGAFKTPPVTEVSPMEYARNLPDVQGKETAIHGPSSIHSTFPRASIEEDAASILRCSHDGDEVSSIRIIPL